MKKKELKARLEQLEQRVRTMELAWAKSLEDLSKRIDEAPTIREGDRLRIVWGGDVVTPSPSTYIDYEDDDRPRRKPPPPAPPEMVEDLIERDFNRSSRS